MIIATGTNTGDENQTSLRVPAPPGMEELIELLNGASVPGNWSLHPTSTGVLRLASGDQFIFETTNPAELRAFLWGVWVREWHGDELAYIEEQARLNRMAH